MQKEFGFDVLNGNLRVEHPARSPKKIGGPSGHRRAEAAIPPAEPGEHTMWPGSVEPGGGPSRRAIVQGQIRNCIFAMARRPSRRPLTRLRYRRGVRCSASVAGVFAKVATTLRFQGVVEDVYGGRRVILGGACGGRSSLSLVRRSWVSGRAGWTGETRAAIVAAVARRAG